MKISEKFEQEIELSYDEVKSILEGNYDPLDITFEFSSTSTEENYYSVNSDNSTFFKYVIDASQYTPQVAIKTHVKFIDLEEEEI